MDNNNAEDIVNDFAVYFASQIDIISKLQTVTQPRQTNFYKKILFATILDSMSRTVFPNKGNRDRFVEFLKKFSAWKEGNHISLPHLVQLLKKAPDPSFEKLRRYANLQIDKWGSSEIILLNRDPSFEEIRKLWPSNNEHRFALGKVELESLQHWHLAYTYRNGLVHEFRTPGRGPEIREEGLPYYISVIVDNQDTEIDKCAQTWELIYTHTFFQNLCTSVLENLTQYLKANRINPFSFYELGTYWISDLN